MNQLDYIHWSVGEWAQLKSASKPNMFGLFSRWLSNGQSATSSGATASTNGSETTTTTTTPTPSTSTNKEELKAISGAEAEQESVLCVVNEQLSLEKESQSDISNSTTVINYSTSEDIRTGRKLSITLEASSNQEKETGTQTKTDMADEHRQHEGIYKNSKIDLSAKDSLSPSTTTSTNAKNSNNYFSLISNYLFDTNFNNSWWSLLALTSISLACFLVISRIKVMSARNKKNRRRKNNGGSKPASSNGTQTDYRKGNEDLLVKTNHENHESVGEEATGIDNNDHLTKVDNGN